MIELAIAGLRLGVHVLGGGVWIGAMFFSVFVLHPRAEVFFAGKPQFEDLLFTVVQGARWKVVAGAAAIATSGAALLWEHRAAGPWWLAVVAAKIGLLLLVIGLFTYVSWVLWPRRVFAAEAELPAIRAVFRRIGALMIAANALNVGLGVLARLLRAGV